MSASRHAALAFQQAYPSTRCFHVARVGWTAGALLQCMRDQNGGSQTNRPQVPPVSAPGKGADLISHNHITRSPHEHTKEETRSASSFLAQEVDHICALLSPSKWDDTIACQLNNLPFPISADHVYEVLQRPVHAKMAICFFLWARQLDSYKPDNRTYNSILNIAIKARQFQTIECLLENLCKDECMLNTIICNALIQLYGMAHKVEEALAVFHTMNGVHYDKPNIRTCNLVLHILVKEGEFERFLGFYGEIIIAGFCPNEITCNICMLYLCKCQNFEEGHNWLDNMPCSPDVVAYSTLIDGLCKAGRMQEADLVLGQMLEADVSPDVSLFTCLIDGFCKGGDLVEGWKLFQYMDAKGIKPNIVTYTALIDKMLKVGETEWALGTLKLMESSDCVPNVYLCTARIDSLCKHGQLETACQLLQHMHAVRCTPNIVTYCVLIDGFLKVRNVPGAMALLNEMRSKGLTPDAYLYASLIYSFAMDGEDAKAKLIFEESVAKNEVPDTRILNCWMSGLYRSRRIDDAYQLFLNLKSEGFIPSTVTFNILIAGFQKTGRMEMAKMMFKSIFKHNCQPDVSSYANVVKGFCRSKDMSTAVKLLFNSFQRGLVHVFQFHVYTIVNLFKQQIEYAKSFLQTLGVNCIYSSPADKSLFNRLLKAKNYRAAQKAVKRWKKDRGNRSL